MNTDTNIVSAEQTKQQHLAAAWWQLLSTDTEETVFWRPQYVVESAWLEHIPFAFWLIGATKPATLVELGTHRGASYFAFCQAVERLGVNTRCYAVDNWKGDIHAGHYDESIFKQVSEHNAAHFSAFSRLVRSDFNDALAHFSDNSIDLLHIDGLHTYEAVKEDFENWLPKLSENAIVIFHDTNVREKGFGVFRFFEQIKQKYPHFEFAHGHGLGVLGVGKSQATVMQSLYAMEQDPLQQRQVQGFFAKLGRACGDMLAASELRELQKSLKQEIENRKSTQKEIDNLNARHKKEIDSLNAKHKEVEQKVSHQVQELASYKKEAEKKASNQTRELAKLAKMYHKADAQLAKARSDFKAVRYSTSWRITLPLRVLGRLYKRLKK